MSVVVVALEGITRPHPPIMMPVTALRAPPRLSMQNLRLTLLLLRTCVHTGLLLLCFLFLGLSLAAVGGRWGRC